MLVAQHAHPRLAITAVLAFACSGALAQTPPTFVNLHYGEDNYRQVLDLYLPEDVCGPAPVVIFVPGGGWVFGDKEHVEPYVDALLSRGFAIAATQHRFANQPEPGSTFPAQIHDIKGTVRFLRGSAAKYNLDPDRFAVFGESSGGHLAALVGTSAGVASLEGMVGNHLNEPSHVHAVGDFYGPIDLFAQGAAFPSPTGTVSTLFGHPILDILKNLNNPDPPYPALVALVTSASPAMHIDGDDPPVFIVHGSEDPEVNISHSVDFHAALTAAGVPATLTVLKGVGHKAPLSAFEAVFDEFQTLFEKPPIIGDVNCDGVVNVDDLVAIMLAWGPCPSKGACLDINGDGEVDVDDLILVVLNWSG
jgi:acetyl esterase/lipase